MIDRQKVVQIIVGSNKEQEFIDTYWRDPEQYFEEYCYAEPEIWVHVFNDLEIPVNFCIRCLDDFSAGGVDDHWPTMHPLCAEKWLKEMDEQGFNKREESSGF